MDNMDKKQCGGMCGGACAGGMGGYGHKHSLVKALLKLIIIALIFMFGFYLGQTVGFIKAHEGREVMIGGGYGMGMMHAGTMMGATTTPDATPAK